MNKKILLLITFIFSFALGYGQCTVYPTPSPQAGPTYTPCIDNTVTTVSVNAGQYVLVNVVQGLNYSFSVGNVFNASGINETLAAFNAGSNAFLTNSTGATGTVLTGTAPFSGQVKILLSKGNCINDGTVGGTIAITVNTVGNTFDSQATFGTNNWIGHIYNSVAGPSPEPFTSTNYVGYYNVTTETINETFGGPTTCLPVFSNGVQRTSIYTEQVAVRYRMKSTRVAGYYFMNANADDGIRITVDGVLVLNDWTDHGNRVYCNNLIYLNGNSDIILDYYENIGDNVVGFSLSPVVTTLNTISSYADRTVCSGVATESLDGSNVFTCVNNKTTYQWQRSSDNVNFTDIAIATTEDYTPLAVTTTSVNITYYRRVLKAFGVVITPANPSTGSVKVITSANTIVLSSALGSDVQTVCKNTAIIPIKYNTTGATGATFTGLPAGITGSWAANVVTISGTPTVAGAALTYTVSLTGGCGSISATGTRTITVTDNNTASAASSSPTLCMNTALTSITHITTGATGIGAAANLPSGITASWSSNTITISGTPTVAGTFNYSIPLTGGCSSATATGSIIVNSIMTVTLNKSNETCTTANNGTVSPTLSGGLTNVRYIKLTQKFVNADAWQQVAEIEAFEIFTGTNVARSTNGATAVASSDYSSSYLAPMAIDGNNSGNNNFWHSGTPNINEWITIDLQSSKNIDFIKIYNRTDCCQQRGQNMLLELFDGSNNLVFSKTIDLYQSGANVPVNLNILDLSWADAATTLNRTGLDSGTYTLNYADAVGCPLSSPIVIGATALAPVAPVPATPIQPTCVVSTGSVILSGLPSSGPWTIIASPTAGLTGLTGTGGTTTVGGLVAGTTYTFSVFNGTCTSPISSNVSINPLPLVATYNGTWTNGPPTIQQSIVFSGNYTSTGNLEGCDCIVNAGVKVAVKSNHALKITNAVKVNTAAGTSLTFENNASLVQINNVANSGNIIYERETAPIKQYDYTYWSSPVLNQKLIDVSPDTDYDKFYSFNALIDNWKQENPQDFMQRGVGYIIRAPENIAAPPFPIGVYKASFVGVPFNGPLSITGVIQDKSYLLGNPYPSALDADKFLTANSSVLDGALYFWTHNTAIGIGVSNPGSGVYAYSSDDYATYNFTGGVGTAVGNFIGNTEQTINKPTGKIAAGQAFFTSSRLNPTGTVIDFNNSMRLDLNGAIMNNTQFFKVNNSTKKTNTIEKHRVWLNLTNTQGAFKQMLVGYLTDATNGYDPSFDGRSYNGNEFIDFYSISDGEFLAIQGRALPFDENDSVPLGYSSAIEGSFSISIDEVDGLLIGQNIYLEDKLNNSIHNLTKEVYTFETTKGTFDDRFVLRYTDKTLGTGDFDTTNIQVLVSVKNNQIKINSSVESIDKVLIIDILGKQIFTKINVGTTELVIPNLGSSEQVLIVKTLLQNGQTVTTKLIY